MKILVDMNLSPQWVDVLQHHGWEAVHWSTVGDVRASDRALIDWAIAHGYVVLTHDLDFGAMLVATQVQGPSVIQVRTQDVLPARLSPLLVGVLKKHEHAIEAGAIVVVEESRSRVRILPLSAGPGG